jgi:integral membrane protein (TIGR01906 family)
MTNHRIFYTVLSWIVAIIIPLVLLMTSVRLLMNPLYPEIEYRVPGFPTDPYGFSLTDRLKWSIISIDYLVNSEGIDYLGNQQLAEGKPLYNTRELSHMLDVKNLVQVCLKIWYGLLIALAVLAVWSWRSGWWKEYTAGLSRGGWITIGLIVLIILATLLNFNSLFTDFHHLFFTGDTWLFEYSDSLIRLFPMKFWEDGFIYMGVMSLIGGLTLGLGFRKSL